MRKIAIVYWSGTGNTEAMADAVAEGVENAGSAASKFTAAEFSASRLEDFDGIAFGCPSMGLEELEESEFAPMFSDCESRLSNRRIALFGSYGWGDGEWMREWEKTCRKAGALLVTDCVICQDAPDEEATDACRNLGAALA